MMHAWQDKLAEIRGYAKADAAPPPSLVKMAKLGIVIGDWMDEFEIDATAIQCWETLAEQLRHQRLHHHEHDERSLYAQRL